MNTDAMISRTRWIRKTPVNLPNHTVMRDTGLTKIMWICPFSISVQNSEHESQMIEVERISATIPVLYSSMT